MINFFDTNDRSNKTVLARTADGMPQIRVLHSGPADAKASRALYDALSPEQKVSLTEAVQTAKLELNPFALAVSKSFGDK